MLGMLLICNPIALFCSEWSLVVIIPYPISFVPPLICLQNVTLLLRMGRHTLIIPC